MKKLFTYSGPIIFIVGVLCGIALMVVYGSTSTIPENASRGESIETLPLDAQYAHVERIIDGDTIAVDGGIKIRLIGIDTPERGEVYFTEASDYLSQLLAGKNIQLQRDISQTDRYGRLLRHVYVDDVWINAEMIKSGLARMATFPPDVMHVETFRDLEKEARENQKGLWTQE